MGKTWQPALRLGAITCVQPVAIMAKSQTLEAQMKRTNFIGHPRRLRPLDLSPYPPGQAGASKWPRLNTGAGAMVDEPPPALFFEANRSCRRSRKSGVGRAWGARPAQPGQH